MLTQSVESFFPGTVEQHAPGQSVALGLRHLGYIDTNLAIGNTERLEGLAVLSFFQQQLAVLVEKLHTT